MERKEIEKLVEDYVSKLTALNDEQIYICVGAFLGGMLVASAVLGHRDTAATIVEMIEPLVPNYDQIYCRELRNRLKEKNDG